VICGSFYKLVTINDADDSYGCLHCIHWNWHDVPLSILVQAVARYLQGRVCQGQNQARIFFKGKLPRKRSLCFLILLINCFLFIGGYYCTRAMECVMRCSILLKQSCHLLITLDEGCDSCVLENCSDTLSSTKWVCPLDCSVANKSILVDTFWQYLIEARTRSGSHETWIITRPESNEEPRMKSRDECS